MRQTRWMLSITELDRLVVSGAGTATADGTYVRSGLKNGRPYYAIDDLRLEWSASPARWQIVVSGTVMYVSSEDVPHPLQVTTWSLNAGVNPVPNVTIDESDSFTQEVHPANTADVKYSWTRDLEAGQIFFRKELATDLVFGGKDRRVDFDRFWYDRLRNGCARYYIRQQRREGGLWRTAWTGRFSTTTMIFDLDRCTATVRPDVLDRYTCLLDSLERKVNALKVGTVDLKVAFSYPLEFGVCESPDPADCGAFSALDGWTFVTGFEHTVGVNYRLYARRREVTICVDGNPVPPPGTGWVLVTDNCALDGTAVYAKALSGSDLFDLNITVVMGTCTGGVPAPPAEGCLAYQLVAPCSEYDPPIYACLGNMLFDFQGARLFKSVLELVLKNGSCSPPPPLVSDFFEWDPPGDTPGYVAGQNYVTGEENEYAHLVLLQNTDAKDPNASNPATRGDITLRDCFDLLRSMRLFWDIDDDGNLRIEHWSAWTAGAGPDIDSYARSVEPAILKPLRSEAPRIERCTWQISQSQDFIGADIEYVDDCNDSSKNTKDYSFGRFVTDLPLINSDPDQVPDDGFTILACREEAGTYTCLITQGAITGSYLSNAPMSWANLHRDLWQHDRYAATALMNNEQTTFISFLPNVEQDKVVVVCPDIIKWSPRDSISGRVAQLLGVPGVVAKADYEDRSEALSLTLRYALP